MHAMLSLGKWPIKAPNLKPLRLFDPFPWAHQKISTKMHSIESRFVIGPSNILFARIYVCNFQPRNFTGWGSERVKTEEECCMNYNEGGKKKRSDTWRLNHGCSTLCYSGRVTHLFCHSVRPQTEGVLWLLFWLSHTSILSFCQAPDWRGIVTGCVSLSHLRSNSQNGLWPATSPVSDMHLQATFDFTQDGTRQWNVQSYAV